MTNKYAEFSQVDPTKVKPSRAKPKSDIKLKHIQLSYVIADGDFDTKMRQAGDHLDSGHRVRLEMRLRGRQADHADLAMAKMVQAVERLTVGREKVLLIEKAPTKDGDFFLAQLRCK